MALNKLTDLNNHLFAQLERLSDESIKKEELKEEINRAKAINGVAKNIIENAKTTLEGAKFSYQGKPGGKEMPEQFKLKAS